MQYDLALILKHLTKKSVGNKMSYEHLNRAIKEFTFKGTDCNDKPGHISEGLSIGGQAMQNFCLLRLIPLFVFDVDFASPIWALLLLLKEVVELLNISLLEWFYSRSRAFDRYRRFSSQYLPNYLAFSYRGM